MIWTRRPFRGPEGFPICDGYDPKSLPDELGVWQAIEDQAIQKFWGFGKSGCCYSP